MCGGGGPSGWESWPSPGKSGGGRQGRGEAQKPHRPRTTSLHRDCSCLTHLPLLVGTHGSHDNSRVKIIPSTNLISSEKSNPVQSGWILRGFLQTRLLETPTSLFFPQTMCMVLMLLLRHTYKSVIFQKRHSEDEHDEDTVLLPGSASPRASVTSYRPARAELLL